MFNQNRILRIFKLITLLKSFPSKSIKRLSQSLEISERSTYRYLDLLVELGFEISKDDANHFALKTEQTFEPFTKEESNLIHEVLSVAVKNNPLVKSIKAKLLSLEERNVLANTIVSSHLAKLVTQINQAIEQGKQLKILKYQSASSESISDRLVEPIGFTSNYLYLCAFEVETRINKFFKLERIGSVENLEQIATFKELHRLLAPDVFGFNESGEKFKIKLRLSMRASLWLRDDYPETESFFSENTDGTWALEVEVNSMNPVNRMLRSMPGEIELE